MFGTKMIGRSVVFGIGYLAGTRAGRARYDQIQQVTRTFAGELRKQLDAAPDSSPSASPGLRVGPGTTATSSSGGRETAVLVSIHVVARLLRVPILRIDGEVVLLDDDRLGTPATNGVPVRRRHELTAGRLLALAEAEMAVVEDRRRQRGAHAGSGRRRGHEVVRHG